MADVTSTALFRALADFSSVVHESAKVKAALGGVDAAGQQSFGRRLQGSIAARSSQMRSFGKTATVGVTVPIIAAGAVMVNTYAEFEKTITQAGLKAGATKKEFAQMEALAIKMGQQTLFSASEAAGALDNLAALGFNARDSMKALPGVMLAAQASGEDLAFTAEVVAKAINAFGLEAKDASHVADVFAQAANTTALNMRDLQYIMANAGEVGSRFGQSLESVVAWGGRLVDLGVPAASAGVAIRQAMVALATPTDKAAGVMRKLGIETRDAGGKMLPIPDLIENFGKGLDLSSPKLKKFADQTNSTTQEVRDYALKSAFGVEGAKAMALAISDGKPVMLEAGKDTKKLRQLHEGLADMMGKKAANAWIKARTEQGKFTARGADTVRALEAMSRASDGTAKSFSDKLGKTTDARIDALKGSLETLAIVVVKALLPGLTWLIEKLISAVNWLVEFSKKHPGIVKIVGAFLAFAAALGPVSWILGVLGGAVATLIGWFLKAWRVIQIVLGTMRVLAFVFGVSVGWIWLIVAAVAAVVAGLIYLWKNNEAFRKALLTAWAAIKKAATVTWNWVKKKVGEFATFLRTKVWPVVLKLWRNVVKPVFKAIGKAIGFMWNKIVKPAFKAWWFMMSKVLFPIIKFLWNKIVKPVFKLIGWWVSKVWKFFLKPAFKMIWWWLKYVIFPVVKMLWTKYIKPVFTWIGEKIRTVWQKWIKPAFEGMKTGLARVKDAFRSIVTKIGNIWDELKKKARIPVAFVVNTVFAGLARAANKIPGMDVPIPKFAKGGVLPGYTPGRDVHHFASPTGGRLALSGGEAFMVPEWTKAVGGPKAVEAMNRAARRNRGRSRHPLKAYALGGVWHPGSRSPDSADTLDRAWDINSPGGTGTPVRAFLDGVVARAVRQLVSYGNYAILNHPQAKLSTLYAHMSKLYVNAGQKVRRGQMIGREGSVGNSTGPHLHFEIGGSGNYAVGGGGGAGGGGFGYSIPNPLSAIDLGAWKKRLSGMGEWGGQMAKVIGALVPKTMGVLKDKITGAYGKVKNWLGDKLRIGGAGDGTLGLGSFVGSIGSSAVRGIVQKMAAARGWGSGSQWSALSSIISRESGWNPGAANPNSSARGLFQKMTSIHGPIESTVGGQTRWGLNYIRGRYGTPVNAWRFWLQHGNYDSGGLLKPGMTQVFNDTGDVESVFTKRQMDKMLSASERSLVASQRVLAHFGEPWGGAAPVAGGDRTVNINMPVYNPVPEPASSSGYKRLRRIAEMGLTDA